MPVNRVERLIINLDTAMPVMCALGIGDDGCERRARTPYQVRVHEHPQGWCTETGTSWCDAGRHSIYAFCSQRHLLYWAHATGWRANDLAARYGGRILGMLPPGERLSNR